MKTILTTVLVVAAALAGCLDAGVGSTTNANEAPSASGGSAATPTPGGATGAPAGVAAGVSRAFLHADGTFATAAADSPGYVAYPPLANNPENTEHARWVGTIEAPANASVPSIPFRLFLSASGPVFAARGLPPFLVVTPNLPGLWVDVRFGEVAYRAEFAGPDHIRPGEIHEITGELTRAGEPMDLPAGTQGEVEIQAAYTSFSQAAELRFVVGPDHPSGWEFPSP